MKNGIILCGLNGAGKSTLGRALAEKLQFHLIDLEDLYFPKADPLRPYASPRSKEEVAALLQKEIEEHEHFILASVKGDYGKALYRFLRCTVYMEVPKELRMQRIRARSYQKFGDRMRPGGDLYEAEEAFFRFAEGREETIVTDWLRELPCPVLHVDGTRPVAETVELLAQRLASELL